MKKVTFLISSALIVSLLLGACNSKKDTAKTQDTTNAASEALVPAAPIEIIGRTATIAFPLFKVDETFTSDSTLHWKIVDEKGVVTEADEKVSFKKINDHQFFVNWIEKTGLTVSQILDAKNETATAFVSRADQKSSRGQRSANFFEGTFKIKD